jgi:hypothetical protein
MVPAAFPSVVPVTTLTELLGPLAPLAVLGTLVVLAILVGLLSCASWATAVRPRARRITDTPGAPATSFPIRPAA